VSLFADAAVNRARDIGRATGVLVRAALHRRWDGLLRALSEPRVRVV